VIAGHGAADHLHRQGGHHDDTQECIINVAIPKLFSDINFSSASICTGHGAADHLHRQGGHYDDAQEMHSSKPAMSSPSHTSQLQAMEQQTISIAKAGITAMLRNASSK